MSSRLVNVRLDEQRIQKARKLRAKGVSLSNLVRDAIDSQYDQIVKRSAPTHVTTTIREIHTEFPDPPDLPHRNYDVHDRRQAGKAIVRQLGRRKDR
jgi:hypothetical protein